LKIIHLRQCGRSRDEQGAKKKECGTDFESHRRIWRRSLCHSYWHSLLLAIVNANLRIKGAKLHDRGNVV
jgi:hypothetical protein